MMTPARSLILLLLALPALIGCNSGPAEPPPLAPKALAAVTAEAGARREPLARAMDAMFADADAGETRALVLLRGGRVIAERYGAGFGPETRQIGWSMSKCVTGILVGELVADGRVRLDETAPVPAWQRSGDPRGEITLRQLLQMRSGLRHTEMGDPIYASDEVRMLYLDGRSDMAGYAEAQPLEAEPGRRFEYSSATTVILADLAGRVLSENPAPAARRAAVSDYLRTRLFEPAGMRSATVEFDRAGTFVGSSLVHATPRDWGKLGELMRNTGSVRGAQVVPRVWIDFMLTPSPREPAYGAQVWLNRPSNGERDTLFPGRAPADVFACVGHLGQYVVVSPGQKLTLVRMGHSKAAQRANVRDHMVKILALFPEWKDQPQT